MRATFERIIHSKKYDLADLTHRVDYYHALGKLTDQDREQLLSLARDSAKDALDYDLKKEVEALWAQFNALRAQVEALAAAAPAPADEPGEEEADPWPDFVQPTGAHDAYYTGAKVTYNGSHYLCRMDGCVWSPDVYPAAWELVANEPIPDEDGHAAG